VASGRPSDESARFLEARGAPERSQQLCESLLQTKGVAFLLRLGLIYAVLVRAYTRQGNWSGALRLCEKLDAGGFDMTFLPLEEMLEIYVRVGKPFNVSRGDALPELPDDVRGIFEDDF
jgi:pentatricopeptide repeat protein